MQNIIILMSFLYQVIAICAEEPVNFFLDKEEILPAKHLLHHPLHQVDHGLEENLILVIRPMSFLLQTLGVEVDDDGGVVIAHFSLQLRQ